MRDFRREIAGLVCGLEDIGLAELGLEAVYGLIEVPSDSALGDYAFPCFRLAKALGKSPAAIAGGLAEELAAGGGGVSVRATGPYLNFFIDRGTYLREAVASALSQGERFGGSELGAGRRVIVEYSSPNIAKPFHIGHIRSTVIGSAIGNIFAFLGYDVVRINHLGDYGTQFGKLIVAYRRFGSKEEVEASPIATLLKYYVEFHKLAEDDPSLEEEARLAFAALERGEGEERALWEWFREESLKEFTVVYELMGISFDSYAGESFYSDKMGRVTEELGRAGLLEESDGARIVDLEAQGLGKALITKRDGSTLYITRDIAAAIYRKEEYGFYKNIYVVASQQDLHFKQWMKIVELMGYGWAGDCVHVPFGLVRLADGVMSTRTGNVVFLEDVLTQAIEKTRAVIVEKGVVTDDVDAAARQIGIGAVVFQELHDNRIKDYVFDWERTLNFEGETGPYAQYGHARACGLLRKAEEMGLDVSAAGLAAALGADGVAAVSDAAFALAKLIGAFPDVVREAGERYEPSLITRHVTDIVQAFSGFYHDEPILSGEGGSRAAKLALAAAAAVAIRNGLGLLGVAAPERM